ncbi:hypothetical protein FOZ63_026936 [Perkinsus olseni]|uniref:Uncharacterized protein n=1 Tax=Perkinsus olseni TaxID=32597 RepID=A0A7J6T7D2_PEROL|nr:hypothetical protein FOZ63_026936 [Perkinsus olseni]KAF4740336.1 hypothetical protein FOZ62_030619 [Perkinsus olseni]
MPTHPEERQKAILLLGWLTQHIDGEEYRSEISLYAWPTVEGFRCSGPICEPMLFPRCKAPDGEGLIGLTHKACTREDDIVEFARVDLSNECTALCYSDVPAFISCMCVDPSDGSLVLIYECGLLYRVYNWDSPGAFISVANLERHRIRSAPEEDKFGNALTVTCCGDGFVYGVWYADIELQVTRISVRDESSLMMWA